MKVSLTTESAVEIFEALKAIRNGYRDIVIGDDGKKSVVSCAYKFDAPTAMRLKMNISNLIPIVTAFEETRNESFTAVCKGCADVPEFAKKYPAEFVKWLADELKPSLAVTQEVDLYKIDEAALLAKNDNILDIVMKLGPILNVSVLSD